MSEAWCEYCEVMMINDGENECFTCPNCNDSIGWDSWYEWKASMRGGW